MPSARPNFKFQITLRGTANPAISRQLSVPASLTFHEFHLVLQTAFGWSNAHLYDFSVRGPEAPETTSRRLLADPRDILFRIEQDPEPPFSFPGLPPPPQSRPSQRVKLFEVFKTPGLKVDYTYDFGDCHEHKIEVIGREPPLDGKRSVCLGGEGHSCAEDIGGDWEELKAAYQNTNPTVKQVERKAWYESICMNGDSEGLSGDGPYRWDMGQVNRELDGLAASHYRLEY